jgi:hypothetical protein
MAKNGEEIQFSILRGREREDVSMGKRGTAERIAYW